MAGVDELGIERDIVKVVVFPRGTVDCLGAGALSLVAVATHVHYCIDETLLIGLTTPKRRISCASLHCNFLTYVPRHHALHLSHCAPRHQTHAAYGRRLLSQLLSSSKSQSQSDTEPVRHIGLQLRRIPS